MPPRDQCPLLHLYHPGTRPLLWARTLGTAPVLPRDRAAAAAAAAMDSRAARRRTILDSVRALPPGKDRTSYSRSSASSASDQNYGRATRAQARASKRTAERLVRRSGPRPHQHLHSSRRVVRHREPRPARRIAAAMTQWMMARPWIQATTQTTHSPRRTTAQLPREIEMALDGGRTRLAAGPGQYRSSQLLTISPHT